MRMDGSDKKTVTSVDETVHDLQFYGGWLYYISWDHICWVKPDGTEKESKGLSELYENSAPAMELVAYGEMYGKEPEFYDLNIADGMLYTRLTIGGSLSIHQIWRVRWDGSDAEYACDSGYDPNLVDQTLFYWAIGESRDSKTGQIDFKAPENKEFLY